MGAWNEGGYVEMSASNEQRALQTVDLSSYAGEILAEEDHPLFDDAVAAAKVGALRSAYVMIWLACAESLKRRFREAKVRDNIAGKVVGKIETMEQQHKAIDRVLVDEAYKYGFVSDSGRTVLSQIYELRCIYGHPYEEAPSHEKVIDAAAAVVGLVLSKPVKLRHAFGRQLLKGLLEDGNYLDDHEPAVTEFAKSILPRLDEDVHVWLLDEYLEELERFADDSSMDLFFRRGMWFCRAMLAEAGVAVFSHEEWHDRSGRFPKTLMGICCTPDIFKEIGERAQDSLVGLIITESNTRARVLSYLEQLDNEGSLSERQRERFSKAIAELELKTVQASGLSTKATYAKLVNAMKSYNWYVQNPAIDMIVSNGPEQTAELTREQQVNLGRNILQAAEGTASSASEFLVKLSQDATKWPVDVIRGIALESFTNEENEIRFKGRYLNFVISALDRLDCIQRKELIADIASSVDVGMPRYGRLQDEFNEVVVSLNSYSWAAPLASALETKLSARGLEEP